jgi:ubiquinone/menaquinone biosynthesis C-methylase UbiE
MAKAGVDTRNSPNDEGEADAYTPETYFTHVHRDYGWEPEVDEVGVSFARLKEVLPEGFALGSAVVLGAGTGRLAWQLAAEFSGEAPVLAVDVNPFPFVVTALLLCGETVELTELAVHPRKSALVATTRTLECPLAAPPKLRLVLADALDPPLARGRFDTVVTPWFVDEVPEDAAVVPELVRSLLREGGSYVCTGPFLYDNGRTKPSLRYCADEFVEMVRRAGFEVTSATYRQESYMASPLSSQGRTEHVLYMHARKDSSRRVERPEVPAFLKPGRGAALSVPRPEGIAEADFSTTEVQQVASLVDGERTVRQITKILLARGVLADDGTAVSGVRGCLKMIFKQLEVL